MPDHRFHRLAAFEQSARLRAQAPNPTAVDDLNPRHFNAPIAQIDDGGVGLRGTFDVLHQDRGLFDLLGKGVAVVGASDLQPKEPVQRYERETPGELLHIDIKKLGRFERTGHRITGDRTQATRGIGWEFLFVAIDDHSRIAFTQMYPDERKESAVSFVQAATQYFASLGITIERVITDNGSAFRSHAFRIACSTLGIRQKFTRAYRPQTNGKAERFIQSALREWAYGHAYANSDQRRAALPLWNHFYNWHRPHHGIGCKTPSSRLPGDGNNVLTLHS